MSLIASVARNEPTAVHRLGSTADLAGEHFVVGRRRREEIAVPGPCPGHETPTWPWNRRIDPQTSGTPASSAASEAR
jgi:hypothetical protein